MKIGLDYVSPSGDGILIARLVAAQIELLRRRGTSSPITYHSPFTIHHSLEEGSRIPPGTKGAVLKNSASSSTVNESIRTLRTPNSEFTINRKKVPVEMKKSTASPIIPFARSKRLLGIILKKVERELNKLEDKYYLEVDEEYVRIKDKSDGKPVTVGCIEYYNDKYQINIYITGKIDEEKLLETIKTSLPFGQNYLVELNFDYYFPRITITIPISLLSKLIQGLIELFTPLSKKVLIGNFGGQKIKVYGKDALRRSQELKILAKSFRRNFYLTIKKRIRQPRIPKNVKKMLENGIGLAVKLGFKINEFDLFHAHIIIERDDYAKLIRKYGEEELNKMIWMGAGKDEDKRVTLMEEEILPKTKYLLFHAMEFSRTKELLSISSWRLREKRNIVANLQRAWVSYEYNKDPIYFSMAGKSYFGNFTVRFLR
jgi:hypothetical protein